MQLIPDSWGSRRVREANDCHEPAGSDKGGQFCDADGVPSRGGKDAPVKLTASQQKALAALATMDFSQPSARKPGYFPSTETKLNTTTLHNLKDMGLVAGGQIYLRGKVGEGFHVTDKGKQVLKGLQGGESKPAAPTRLKLSTRMKTTPAAFIDEVFEKHGQSHPMLGRNETILGGTVIAELQDRGSSVYLTGLRSVEQGKGHGAKAMQLLTDLADEKGVTLTLLAKPLDVHAPLTKTPKARLVAFYKRFGFVPDKDYGGGHMIRRPQ